MPETGDAEMSHADRHDLDKLARWKSDLDGPEGKGAAGLPYCAIFLVGPDHRASHDIFRRYRSAFEDTGRRLSQPGDLRPAWGFHDAGGFPG